MSDSDQLSHKFSSSLHNDYAASEGASGEEEEESNDQLGPIKATNTTHLRRSMSTPVTKTDDMFSSPSSKSNLTMRKRNTKGRVSTALDIGTGKEESGRVHYAMIRPEEDSKPMGKFERRNNHVARFFTLNNFAPNSAPNSSRHSDSGLQQWLAMDSGGENESSESVAVSKRGRFNVRAEAKTFSVADVMSSFNEDEEGAQTDEDGAESKKKGEKPKSYHFETTTQYRLNATRPSNTFASKLLRRVGFSPGDRGMDNVLYDEGCSCLGFAPNTMVAKYLHWTFRRSFTAVFFSAAVGFYSVTLFFALLMFWIGQYRPQCIYVNGNHFSENADASAYEDFGDAYALSWTSFSTVGYGLVFPSTSAVNPNNINQCLAIEFICVLESFVGILFASFCGAIMVGKVTRLRSHAQVVFSDAVVVRYGTGVLTPDEVNNEDDDNRSNKSGHDEEETRRDHPCPVLEFRIANRLHSTIGGEIMDCSMNIVASIDEAHADHMLRKANTNRRRRRGKLVKRVNRGQKLRAAGESNGTPTMPNASLSIRTMARNLREQGRKQSRAFDEDPSGKIVPKRIFCKLEVETPDHPFFKRIWTARHTLDLESPIVAEEAKQMIRLNNGFWPNELNDPESVRASLNCDQILVSLSGTSNADANSVYAQHVYNFQDINIGYRFVNMIYRDERDGHLKADISVINDVVEQAGGGGEELPMEDSNVFAEILVL